MESLSTLEQEIAEIEKRLTEKKAALKQSQERDVFSPAADKAILKEVVKEKIAEHLPLSSSNAFPANSLPTFPMAPMPKGDQPSYLQEQLHDRVQELVNLAFNDTLTKAIKEAVKTGNAALIDAFHSVLVDQLYDTLIERGKLKKVA